MITRIEATRYRCLDRLDAELDSYAVLVGANGAGKTTLIEALAGRRELDGGRLRTGHNVQLGYLSQHAEELGSSGTVLEAAQRATRLTPNKTRALLGRFLFSGEEAEKPVADTKPSGGSGTSVTLPALGESVTEGTVTRWLKSVGDDVAVDEPLLEVSTDKVDTEIPSPVAGTLLEILVGEDETAEVGADLARIGDASAAPAADASTPGETPAPQAEEPAEEESLADEVAVQEKAQAQAEAAFARQAQLQAFQVDVPEGVERRTVYSFHLAAGQ